MKRIMKSRHVILNTVAMMTALFIWAGCGGGSQTEVEQPPAESEAPADAETSAEGETQAEAEGAITVTGNDQMKFSMTEFTVSAGSEVEIVFQNVGQLPKEAMGHNLLILTQQTDPIAFANASAGHPQNDYVAPELEDQVIAGTPILGPGESETLTFTAPEEPGEYPFICSFPGHAAAGMRGVMRVE